MSTAKQNNSNKTKQSQKLIKYNHSKRTQTRGHTGERAPLNGGVGVEESWVGLGPVWGFDVGVGWAKPYVWAEGWQMPNSDSGSVHMSVTVHKTLVAIYLELESLTS